MNFFTDHTNFRFGDYWIVSCIAILAVIFDGKVNLPAEFEYVFKCYSGTLKNIG